MTDQPKKMPIDWDKVEMVFGMVYAVTIVPPLLDYMVGIPWAFSLVAGVVLGPPFFYLQYHFDRWYAAWLKRRYPSKLRADQKGVVS
jgi:hypothetical protein